MMKLALIGYGKMGRMIESVALEQGHSITAIIDSSKKISQKTIGQADICIDFTNPNAVVDNIRACASLGKNIVVGTTGWQDQMEAVQNIVKKTNIGLLYSPNFSLGVHLFMRLVSSAGKLMSPFPQYDLALSEEHHKQKLDMPSGTALAIAEALKDAMNLLKEPEISSLRCGFIPGTHSITFDSPVDTITLTHTARSRVSLAQGAVAAAVWLNGKKGFYTLQDMLEK